MQYLLNVYVYLYIYICYIYVYKCAGTDDCTHVRPCIPTRMHGFAYAPIHAEDNHDKYMSHDMNMKCNYVGGVMKTAMVPLIIMKC